MIWIPSLFAWNGKVTFPQNCTDLHWFQTGKHFACSKCSDMHWSALICTDLHWSALIPNRQTLCLQVNPVNAPCKKVWNQLNQPPTSTSKPPQCHPTKNGDIMLPSSFGFQTKLPWSENFFTFLCVVGGSVYLGVKETNQPKGKPLESCSTQMKMVQRN